MKRSMLAIWTDMYEKQRKWVEDCGGDLAGYLQKYHVQHGRTVENATAIYQADLAELERCYEKLMYHQGRPIPIFIGSAIIHLATERPYSANTPSGDFRVQLLKLFRENKLPGEFWVWDDDNRRRILTPKEINWAHMS